MADERALDAVEKLVLFAADAGLPLTHMAMAFAVAHPAVTSANIGPRTMQHFDDLLAGAEVVLSDEVMEQIDSIAPQGIDAGLLEAAYNPPPMKQASLRRRPLAERAAG